MAVVQDSLPKIVTHAQDVTNVFTIDNYRQTIVIDPAIAWWTSGAASADKGNLTAEAPKFSQSIDFGRLKGDYATTVNANGSVSSTVKQEIADIAFKVASTDKDGNPVSSSGRMDNVGLQYRDRRTEFEEAVRPDQPSLRPSGRSLRARGGTEGSPAAAGGAGLEVCRGRGGVEAYGRLAARRYRACRRQGRRRRHQRRAGERGRRDHRGRGPEPAGRTRSARRRRPHAVENRPRPDRQGDRRRSGRQHGDRQPASRRPGAGDLGGRFRPGCRRR